MKTEDCIRQILKNIGENPDRDDLRETPGRVAKMYDEIFSGYKMEPSKILKVFDSDGYDEMIFVKNIEYFSTCEHHLSPFFGVANIAYIPNKKITGLSKLPRLVDVFARRLQNQERLTVQIAESLFQNLNPIGVAIQISGRHLCMCSRGVAKTHSETITTKFCGEFVNNLDLRRDFFSQI